MTTTPTPTRTGTTTEGRSALREGALVLTVLACLPYLLLKTAWVVGSDIGIPADSVLHDYGATMRFANALTILMDAAAVALAFCLARSWGRRVPAALLLLPAWVATGLLTPILLAYPLQSLLNVAVESSPTPDFLEPWVFVAVYGGFFLQGIGLGLLLALHARDRWAPLWRRRVADFRGGGDVRLPVTLATAVLVVPVGFFVGRLLGADWAWTGTVERTATQQLVHGVLAAVTMAGLVATWAWVVGRSRVRAAVPVLIAWVGSATVGAWGAWMLFATTMSGPVGQSDVDPRVVVVQALAAMGGILLLVAGAHTLTSRRGTLEGTASM